MKASQSPNVFLTAKMDSQQLPFNFGFFHHAFLLTLHVKARTLPLHLFTQVHVQNLNHDASSTTSHFDLLLFFFSFGFSSPLFSFNAFLLHRSFSIDTSPLPSFSFVSFFFLCLPSFFDAFFLFTGSVSSLSLISVSFALCEFRDVSATAGLSAAYTNEKRLSSSCGQSDKTTTQRKCSKHEDQSTQKLACPNQI